MESLFPEFDELFPLIVVECDEAESDPDPVQVLYLEDQLALFESDWELEALAQPDTAKPWFWFPREE